MSEGIDYKGKDVEAAITLACNKLNVSRDELRIEIVSPGSKGIFGLGRKMAVIKASIKNAANGAAPANQLKNKTVHKPIKKSAGRKSGTPLPEKKTTKVENLLSRTDEALSTPPSPETVEEITSLLHKIVVLMGYPSEVTATVNGNKISAHIAGEHTEALIGRDGDTLDAVQYLMRKIISQKRYPDKLFFSLDCGNFRDLRKIELEELALAMADEVKETGKTRTIAALNPAERRIIHVTLQDDNNIRSSSIGEGLYKKIRIFAPGKGRKRPGRRPRPAKSSSGQ
jgi:spoIIIJ-associated protein